MIRPHDCMRHIYYCLNLAHIITKILFEKACTCLYSAHAATLTPLPEQSQSISAEIKIALPFAIPLENRNNTCTMALALQKIFKFDQLLAAYFVNMLSTLPEEIENLHLAVKDLFPITEYEELTYLGKYWQKFCNYYIFDRIPEHYFALPAPKKKLPNTLQALNSALRHLFPYFPKDSVELRHLQTTLCEHYSFCRLPNDYFKQKDKLSADPKIVKTSQTYSFPI